MSFLLLRRRTIICFVSILYSILPLFGYGQLRLGSNESAMLSLVGMLYERHSQSGPYATRACYYEIAEVDGKVVSYADASGALLSFGHNCTILPACLVFMQEQTRKANIDKVWQSFINESFFDEDDPESDPPLGYQPEIISLLTAYRYFEMRGPINTDHTKNFRTNLVQNDDVLEIHFSTRRFSSARFPYEGIIYANAQTETIDSILVSNAMWHSQQHRTAIEGFFKVYYLMEDDVFRPQKIVGGYSKNGIQLSVGMTVTGGNSIPFSFDFAEFNMYQRFSISPKISFDENGEMPYCSKDGNLLRAERDLGQNMPLIRQFRENNHKSFHTSLYLGRPYPDFSIKAYDFVPSKLQELLKELSK